MEELKRNREARMAAREDMEMISREQDRSQYSDWRRVEDSFHLKQVSNNGPIEPVKIRIKFRPSSEQKSVSKRAGLSPSIIWPDTPPMVMKKLEPLPRKSSN